MIRAYKTQINPTKEQIILIEKTFGVCRYVYNWCIKKNEEIYAETKKFMFGYDLSKYLNNEFRIEHPECSWIQEVSSKAVKQSIMNFDKSLHRYLKDKKDKKKKHKSEFPKIKKKGRCKDSFYLAGTIKVYRNKIQIPTLGEVRLCESNFIPKNNRITSCTISKKAGKYYISCLVKENIKIIKATNDGIGIDLGLKDFAILSNGKVYKNINKSYKIKKIEKKLKREQRSLSKKISYLKKGGNATHKNLDKQKLKVQKIYQRLVNIRTDYINKIVYEIAKTKPSYITIEDLNIKGMMKNKHLSKSVQQQKFYEFRIKLLAKCIEHGIELRIANRFFPSSKICSQCGCIKHDLKLKDRIYKCEHCGTIIDRDYNASINLKNTEKYKIAK